MRKMAAYLRDERGVETLEWIIVGGLIAGVAVAVYSVAMQGGLMDAVNAIVAYVKTKATP